MTIAVEERELLKQNFINSLSDKEWEVIADALFESQCQKREEFRYRNASDRDWQNIDDIYSLYIDLCTFVLRK